VERSQPRDACGVGQRHHWARIIEHASDLVVGESRVDAREGGTRFEDGELCQVHVFAGPWQEHGYDGVFVWDDMTQALREGFRSLRQRLIADRSPFGTRGRWRHIDGRSIGPLAGGSLEKLVEEDDVGHARGSMRRGG
jgi:hypothetical protein